MTISPELAHCLFAFVLDYANVADCGDGECGRTDGTCWHCTAVRLVEAVTGQKFEEVREQIIGDDDFLKKSIARWEETEKRRLEEAEEAKQDLANVSIH